MKLQLTKNCPATPPAFYDEDQPLLPQHNFGLAANRQTETQPTVQYKLLKKQNCEIKQLRQKIRDYQKNYDASDNRKWPQTQN